MKSFIKSAVVYGLIAGTAFGSLPPPTTGGTIQVQVQIGNKSQTINVPYLPPSGNTASTAILSASITRLVAATTTNTSTPFHSTDVFTLDPSLIDSQLFRWYPLWISSSVSRPDTCIKSASLTQDNDPTTGQRHITYSVNFDAFHTAFSTGNQNYPSGWYSKSTSFEATGSWTSLFPVLGSTSWSFSLNHFTNVVYTGLLNGPTGSVYEDGTMVPVPYQGALGYFFTQSVVSANGSYPVYEKDFGYFPSGNPAGVTYVPDWGYLSPGSFPGFVYTPVGTLEHTQSGGGTSTTTPLTQATAAQQLQALTWPDPATLTLTGNGGSFAEFRFGAAQSSASKLVYQIQFTPSSTGLVLWQETFTPTGASIPSDIRWMSYNPASPEESVTPTYLIDPFDTSNAHRFGDTPGDYKVVQFDISANMVVDANRDGTIKLASEDDTDATSAEKPYRFWINDDIDQLVQTIQESEQDDSETTSFITPPDWKYESIHSQRDLEDFARLQINTTGLNDSIMNGSLYIGFKWFDVSSGNPAVKLYKNQEVDGGTGYLNTPDVAQNQVGVYGDDHVAIPDAAQSGYHTIIEGSGVFVLPTSLFSNLSETQPKTYLLFEGCKSGAGQLKLVILKKENDSYSIIGEGPGVWLDLKEPKEFIQRWTCGDTDRGSINTVALDSTKSGAFAPPITDEEKDLILYVHGYNMSEFLKQRWIETTFKRLYWLGYKGRVGGFTWPCAQSALPFDASEENAYKAGAQLHALLNTLKDQGYRVHLLGHSQGNVVVGEALRQAGTDSDVAETYVASQAAIPAHCYDAAQPERSGPVAFVPTTANVYRSFYAGTEGENPNLPKTWSTDDPAYLAQSQLNGSVRKFVNFFNPQDYALSGNGISLLADDGAQPGWLVDQRLKPNLGWRYYDNEGFIQMTGPAQSPTITYLSSANPTQRYQIFAYGAQARSLALGASTGMGGVFAGSAVNLFDAPYNFRNQHIYHSGQFRSFYAQRWQYWHELLSACRLFPRTKP